MATRRPVKLDGSNLKEMSDSEITDLKNAIAQSYLGDQTSNITVVSSGGDFGNLADTRKTAGDAKTDYEGYPSEATTPEPGTVTVNYNRFNQSISSTSMPSAIGDSGWWLYYDGSDLREMSTTDVIDTLINPAIDIAQGLLPYRVYGGSSLSGYTRVSSTQVFLDTRANTGLYSSGGIPEALDQPITIQQYWLHKRNSSVGSYIKPVYYNGGNVVEHNSAMTTMKDICKHYIANVTGYRLRWSINGSGTSSGSMTDTRLNGSGNYQRRYVGEDDYRAQEFPNGSAVTVSTYTLKVRKV